MNIWRGAVRQFFSSVFYRTTFLTALLVNLLVWLLLGWKIRPQQDTIFLHYTIYFGIDKIGAWYQLYFLPAGALLILLSNTFLSCMLRKTEPIATYFLMISALLIQFIVSVGVTLITWQNINIFA